MEKAKKILFDKFIGTTIEKRLPIDVNKLGSNYTEIKNAIFKEYAGKSFFELKNEVTKLQKSPDKIFDPFKNNPEFMGKLENVTRTALHGAIDKFEKSNPMIDVDKLGSEYLELKNSIVNEYSKDIKDLSKLIKKAPELAQNPHKILEPFVKNPEFMGKLENVTRTALKDKIPEDHHKIINDKVTTDNLIGLIKSKNPLDHISEKEPDLFDMISQNNPELVESYQTSQKTKSKESTNVNLDDKSSLYILVGIIVIANILTYNTFKFLNPKGKNQIELAILYVIIYVYSVLYSIIICYISKWLVRLADLGLGINVENKIELIEKLIKNIFDLAIYTLPFHILIGILSLAFQKHLMFDHKNDFSWSYQLFSCIISIVAAYIYKDKDISLVAEQLIRYYIMFVTVLSLVKINVNIDGSSTINRFADGIVNLFLNINLNKIIILLPLILLISGIVMVTLGVDIPTLIQFACLCLFVFITILSYGTAGTYFSKLLGLNVNKDKAPKLPVLKAVSKWFVFMSVYLIPLYAYIAMTKGELLGDFSKELLKTFNVHFIIILISGTITLFILDKAFGSMDEKQMAKLSSLMILVSIGLSNFIRVET